MRPSPPSRPSWPRPWRYLGINPRQYPGPRQQTDALLRILRQPGTLLILDGFERALRAYASLDAAYQGDEVQARAGRDHRSQRDCVSPAGRTLPALAGRPAGFARAGADDHAAAAAAAGDARRHPCWRAAVRWN